MQKDKTDVLKYRRKEKIWNQWSVSKLIQLYECPLALYFRYMLKIKVPRNPYMIFGTAVHFMFKRFFDVNYQSPESFAGAWKHFWYGVAKARGKHRHGPEGYSAPPVKINFRDPETEFYQLQAIGVNIMKKFYENNISYKVNELMPKTEISFEIDFQGLRIIVKMDRIQPMGDGTEEIWDYKPRLPSKANIRDDAQLTLYNLAYKSKFGCDPSGLVIYNYKNSEKHWVKPRRNKYYVELAQWLNEARAYVWGVLFWKQYQEQCKKFPFEYNFSQFRNFDFRDVENGVFSPRYFPNSNHCKMCDYYKQCWQWRNQHSQLSVVEKSIKIIQPRRKISIQQELFS